MLLELRRRAGAALPGAWRQRGTGRWSGAPGTVGLGLLAAVAGWNLIVAPPSSGLDPSWQAALYMAAHRGLLFGSQAVFTYGPLGFLRVPGLWYSGLGVLAFLYSSLLYTALAVSLVWSLRGAFPLLVAFLITALLFAACPSIEVPVALVAVWSLIALSPRADAPLAEAFVLYGAGFLAGIETLISLRSGPVIFLIGAATLLVGEARVRRLAVFVAVTVGVFFAAWFAAGQTLGNLGGYVSAEVQIITGYSQAMGGGSLTALQFAGILLLTVAVIVLGVLSARRGPGRLAAAFVLVIAGLALYKEAIVREDTGHVQLFVSTLAVIGAGVGFAGRRWLATPAVLAMIVAALAMPRPPGGDVALSPVGHFNLLAQQVGWELDPTQEVADARFFMAIVDRMDPTTLALLRGHRVDVDPWEQSVAWLYNLDWQPLPVFQDYSAYTSGLDRLNADALSSPRGPQRILRENISVLDSLSSTGDLDLRLPAWDPPAQTIAMLCHFTALHTTERWQVVSRVPDRCGRPRLLRTFAVRTGQPLALPAAPAGGVTYAKIDGAGVAGREVVRSLLFRARQRFLVLNGTRVVRIVPGTAGDGLLMNSAPGIDFPAPFAVAPEPRTITFQGLPGPFTVRLYWLPVRAAARR